MRFASNLDLSIDQLALRCNHNPLSEHVLFNATDPPVYLQMVGLCFVQN